MAVEGDNLARAGHVGTELVGLGERTGGEFDATDAGGEAEGVLDARARGGLPPGGGAVEEHRAPAFGGAGGRGGEARRSATDDNQVIVVAVVGAKRQPDVVGDVTGGRASKDRGRRDDSGKVVH